MQFEKKALTLSIAPLPNTQPLVWIPELGLNGSCKYSARRVLQPSLSLGLLAPALE